MYFDRLQIKNFRNFSEQDLKFSQALNVFVGPNGHGKSNLLEALYLQSHAKSFRTNKNIHFLRKKTGMDHEPISYIKSKIFDEEKDYEIHAELTESKKSIFLNDKKLSGAQLFAKIPSVLFSPESLSVIKEGPELRRNLIDDLVVMLDPPLAKTLSDYEKCQKSRNRVLKGFIEEGVDIKKQELILQSINESFFKLATDVTINRWNAIKKIESDFQKTMCKISNLSNVEIHVDYVISSQKLEKPTYESVFNATSQRALELHSAEISSGTSLVGPHKHDIHILYNGNDSRYYCSQGQQRALILAFKIAQIVYHIQAYKSTPILLLDDVLSELDGEKRKHLIEFLQVHQGQTFITTTDFSLSSEFQNKNIKVFEIKNGEILALTK